MPSGIRVTLALNSQQTKKTALIVPTDAAVFEYCIGASKMKLRLKKPSRMFIQRKGGDIVELHRDEDLYGSDLENDCTILVSAGEDYVGVAVPRTSTPMNQRIPREQSLQPSSHHEETPSDTANPRHIPPSNSRISSQSIDPTSAATQAHPSSSQTSHPLVAPTEARVRVIANESYIEPKAQAQLNATATLPGIISAIGMPDLHPGNRFPIGAAFISRGIIYPPLIGGDIGCGMALYRTGIRYPYVDTLEHQQKHKTDEAWSSRLAAKIHNIEGAWPVDPDDDQGAMSWLEHADVALRHVPFFKEHMASLGTIGGGNHFAELQVVEDIRDQAAFNQYVVGVQPHSNSENGSEASTDLERNLLLMVHSGSRGLGQSILKSSASLAVTGESSLMEAEAQTASQPSVDAATPFIEDTPAFRIYLKLHDNACRWARSNRDLIAHRILSLTDKTYDPTFVDISFLSPSRKILDIWHNSVEKRSWEAPQGSSPSNSPTDSKDDGGKDQSPDAWVHRKGAAPSDKGLVVIPGSRGAKSFLVLPIGPQQDNGYSLAHGAGRALTRTKAYGDLSRKYSKKKGDHGNPLNTTSLGSHVIWEDRTLLFEEAPEAYKDVESVVKDLEDEGIIKVVATLRPVVTYKVRKE